MSIYHHPSSVVYIYMGSSPPPPKVLDLPAMGARHWRIVPCSAVTGAGLLEGFDWVVGDISSRIYLLE